MSLDADIRIGDRILCALDGNWGVVRALLIDPGTPTLERIVIEPPHMVAVGAFIAAERLSFPDGVLTFDGALMSFDLDNRAETQEWSDPPNRNVGTISGRVVPVEGLLTLDGTTEAYDLDDNQVGTIIGVTTRDERVVDNLVVRTQGRLRHKDVYLDVTEDIAELAGIIRLNVGGGELRETKGLTVRASQTLLPRGGEGAPAPRS